MLLSFSLSLSTSGNIWNTTGINIYNTEAGSSGYHLSVFFFLQPPVVMTILHYPIWY